MATELKQQFNAAMVRIYTTARKDLGYNATRFIQMVADHGGVAAACQLLNASAPSDGFTTLWEHKRLDLSVEALVTDAKFVSLFTDAERRIVDKRLDDYGDHR